MGARISFLATITAASGQFFYDEHEVAPGQTDPMSIARAAWASVSAKGWGGLSFKKGEAKRIEIVAPTEEGERAFEFDIAQLQL